jgi:NADH-quinone oxidoreductase subunit G
VLRLAADKLSGTKHAISEFTSVRGIDETRELSLAVGGAELRLAVVSGLGNARRLIDKIRSGEARYDFVEVMACPGGCVAGAGQPVYRHQRVRQQRTRGLYEHETLMQVQKSQDNPFISDLYAAHLGEAGSPAAHRLLHTGYQFRRRTFDEGIALQAGADHEDRIAVSVCFGTSCFLRGAQSLMQGLLKHIRNNNLEKVVDIRASFCFEQCDRGPTVTINGKQHNGCTLETVVNLLDRELAPVRRNA